MMRVLPGAVLCLISTFAFAEPSLVLVNGKVFTGDAAKPSAEAIAIEGNRITAVGTTAEVKALAGAGTRVIDVGGKRIVPGFNDAHTHPLCDSPGLNIDRGIDPKWEELAPAIRNAAEESSSDVWIHARIGPAVINDEKITAATLDRLAPGRMVHLQAFTGHGAILSTAALKALRVPTNATDPRGGWYGRDSVGNANGRAFEYAHYPLEQKISEMRTDEELTDSLRNFASEAIGYGITSVQSMPCVTEKRFLAAVKASGTPLRVRPIALPLSADPGRLSSGGAVKWILDGTPMERNAATRTAYASGGSGRENFPDLAPFFKLASESKRQLLLHASGDKTVESVLKALAATPLERTRIEHGDGLLPDLVPLAKRTGVIVVGNPTHFPFGGAYERPGYMPFRSLLDAGIPIAIGSDGPMNPFLNILLATHRELAPSEALTREQAVRAYTSGSAFAEMTEKEKGTIAKGMLADVAVLSQDVLTAGPDVLPATVSVLTVIDGKVVHER